MNPIERLPILVALFAASLALTVSGGVQAGVENGDVFKDWKVECSHIKDKEGKESEVCSIAQVATSADGKPVVKVQFGYRKATDKPMAQFLVPLGVVLTVGLGLKIDDGKAIAVPFHTCLPSGCQSVAPLGDDFLQALKKGRELAVMFQFITGQRLGAKLSLSGVTAGLDALAGE